MAGNHLQHNHVYLHRALHSCYGSCDQPSIPLFERKGRIFVTLFVWYIFITLRAIFFFTKQNCHWKSFVYYRETVIYTYRKTEDRKDRTLTASPSVHSGKQIRDNIHSS